METNSGSKENEHNLGENINVDRGVIAEESDRNININQGDYFENIEGNYIQGDVVGGNKFDIRFYALASLEKNGNIAWLNRHQERSEPYKFLSYYETTDADIFYGREAVSELLASKISTHKQVLINGQSGSGKTSLINAGIIPNLIKKGYFTMVFRDYGYPTDVIKDGLENLKNINLDLSNCHSLLDCLVATRKQINRPLVIFFDQFERFFLNLNSSERQKFINEFSECLKSMNPQEMNFFIAIRQDFYGNLGEFWQGSEFNTESYPHYLETLSQEEAITAIENPLTAITDKIGYENNFVKQTLLPDLLQSSAKENQKQINPVHLQIVCNELFNQVKKTKSDDIQANKIILIGQELYENIGRVEGVLRSYVTEILDDRSKFSFKEQEIAKSVLQQMVTSQGTRVFRSLEKLTKKLDYSRHQIELIIKKLDGIRLLETRNTTSNTEYSITHEYLAKQINQWYDPKKLEIKRVQEMWARCLDNWRLYHNTIPRNQFKDIKKFKFHLQIKENGRSLLRASSFAYWLRDIAIGLGITTLIGLTIASLIGNRNATINQIRASVQASEANFNSDRRLETLVEAVKAAKTLDRSWLLNIFPPNKDRHLESQVKKVLYQGHVKTLERNRLEGHQGSVNSAEFSPDGKIIVTASSDRKAKLWTREGVLVATLEGHQGSVKSAKFSPNGKFIVTASTAFYSDHGTAKLWTREGVLVATLEGHQGSVNSAEFSPDGEFIVTASSDRKAKLWTREGGLVATLEGHQDWVNSAEFSPDGQFIVTASGGVLGDDVTRGTAKLWTREGRLVATLEGHQDFVNSAEFSPDGQFIITASARKAKLWNREGEFVATLEGHQDLVNSAEFSPDGEFIVTASSDDTAKLWTREGGLVATLEGHQGSVNSAEFSPDGEFIVTASSDRKAKLWTREGGLVATLEGHQDQVTSAEFSPDGESIITASLDDTAKLWTRERELVATLKGHQDQVTSAEFSPDGESIVTASLDDTAKLWTRERELIATLEGHQGFVYSAEFSPDSESIVTASLDDTAKLWTREGVLIATLEGHQGLVYSAEFSLDGQYIITASSDDTAKLWTREGVLVATLEGHQDRVWNAEFSPDGQYIITASIDGTAKLWTREGVLVATLEGHQGSVESAEFSPDGQYIITASIDGTAKLWTRERVLVATLEGHQGSVKSAEFSPDGQYVITASYDGTAKLWNREGGLVATLKGHQGPVTSAEFSPDGQYVITASYDGTAKLWTREGGLVATLEGHQNLVRSAEFSPDGQYIITASSDRAARLWKNFNFDYMLAQACQEIIDYLKHNPNVNESDRNLCDGISAVED